MNRSAWMRVVSGALVASAALLSGCGTGARAVDAAPVLRATRPAESQLVLDEPGQAGLATGRLGPGASLAPDGSVILAATPSEQARFDSSVIIPEIVFNEVLLSWNLDVPEGAGACVLLRVGREAGGEVSSEWSPWLYVGDWGAPPSVEKMMQSPHGKIDVDFFTSTQTFDRVQYRVVAAGGPVRIARIGVCLSNTLGNAKIASNDRSVRPADRGAFTRRLTVPFNSQKTPNPALSGRLCSPTSLSMVMAYYGVDRPVSEVAAKVYDAPNDIYGGWPRNIQAAYAMGVPGYLTRFSHWAEVEHLIAQQRPVIASIYAKKGELPGAPYDATEGHLIVVTGFEGDEWVLVNDPAMSSASDGQIRLKRDDLARAWFINTGGTAYVLDGTPTPVREASQGLTP